MKYKFSMRVTRCENGKEELYFFFSPGAPYNSVSELLAVAIKTLTNLVSKTVKNETHESIHNIIHSNVSADRLPVASQKDGRGNRDVPAGSSNKGEGE